MMEFGKSLKAAREAKGLSVAQLVEATHLAPMTIAELEGEDFSHIAAPIYGRGFVKLYCEAVGLDPKPFVNEFMEIFSGNHDTEIRERPVAPEEQARETVQEEHPAAEAPAAETVYTTDSLFASDPLYAPEPTPPSHPVIPTPPPVQRQTMPPTPPPSSLPTPPADAHAISRYAAPIRRWQPVIPTSAWRIGVLALGALALLALLVLGVRAIYRATSAAPAVSEAPTQERPTQTESSAPAKPTAVAEKANNAKTGRTPQSIPALYVD